MGELPQAIQLERAVLSAFKGRSSALIDTGNLRARELRQMIRDRYGMDWSRFSAALTATPAGNGGAMLLPWFEPEITPLVPNFATAVIPW